VIHLTVLVETASGPLPMPCGIWGVNKNKRLIMVREACQDFHPIGSMNVMRSDKSLSI
jgi:hypothetical protein